MTPIVAIRIALVLLVVLLWTLVLLPVQLVGIWLKLPVRMRLPRWWHRVACPALGIRVHVHGALERGRPLLLASNHVSWKDIMVLGSVADVVYIAKSEVRTWPVFGWLARLQRSVFIERERKRETGRQISDVAERLDAGEIVVLFAEGTTSDGNRILEFKSSLFGAASAALPLGAERRGLRAARRHRLHPPPRHADGAHAPADRRLAGRRAAGAVADRRPQGGRDRRGRELRRSGALHRRKPPQGCRPRCRSRPCGAC